MNEEDRKKYALAQAGQRAAGGAYMTGPPAGQVYELTEAQMKEAGWRDSVESVDSALSRPSHSRGDSYNSFEQGEKASPVVDETPVESASTLLSVPQTSSNGHNRRSGRSPLARVSLIRTPSNDGNDGNDIELEQQRRQGSRSPSVGRRN